ncbi:transposase [Methylobacterium brachiatum]|uniref:transposase n=1 Tax=Methylobacterium brachiatum TaxID=269660 RepID=UPI003CC7AD22
MFWLSDEAWARIEPHLPHGQPGKPRVNDRRVISGILHVLKVGYALRVRPAHHDLQPLQRVVPARALAAAVFRDRSRRPCSRRTDA